MRWRRSPACRPTPRLTSHTVSLGAQGQVAERRSLSRRPPRTRRPATANKRSRSRAFRAVQAREKLAAGKPMRQGADYVACDELGAPLDPAGYGGCGTG